MDGGMEKRFRRQEQGQIGFLLMDSRKKNLYWIQQKPRIFQEAKKEGDYLRICNYLSPILSGKPKFTELEKQWTMKHQVQGEARIRRLTETKTYILNDKIANKKAHRGNSDNTGYKRKLQKI